MDTKETKEPIPYEDVSIFQGWRQFIDNNGQWWRLEHSADCHFRVFKEDNGAFTYNGSVAALDNDDSNENILRRYLYPLEQSPLGESNSVNERLKKSGLTYTEEE